MASKWEQFWNNLTGTSPKEDPSLEGSGIVDGDPTASGDPVADALTTEYTPAGQTIPKQTAMTPIPLGGGGTISLGGEPRYSAMSQYIGTNRTPYLRMDDIAGSMDALSEEDQQNAIINMTARTPLKAMSPADYYVGDPSGSLVRGHVANFGMAMPIIGAGAAVGMPLNLLDNRKQSLLMAAKLASQRPKDNITLPKVFAPYSEMFNKNMLASLQPIMDEVAKTPNGRRAMKDPSTPVGKKYNEWLGHYNSLAENINQTAREFTDLVNDNTYAYIPGLREKAADWLHGVAEGAKNPEELIKLRDDVRKGMVYGKAIQDTNKLLGMDEMKPLTKEEIAILERDYPAYETPGAKFDRSSTEYQTFAQILAKSQMNQAKVDKVADNMLNGTGLGDWNAVYVRYFNDINKGLSEEEKRIVAREGYRGLAELNPTKAEDLRKKVATDIGNQFGVKYNIQSKAVPAQTRVNVNVGGDEDKTPMFWRDLRNSGYVPNKDAIVETVSDAVMEAAKGGTPQEKAARFKNIMKAVRNLDSKKGKYFAESQNNDMDAPFEIRVTGENVPDMVNNTAVISMQDIIDRATLQKGKAYGDKLKSDLIQKGINITKSYNFPVSDVGLTILNSNGQYMTPNSLMSIAKTLGQGGLEQQLSDGSPAVIKHLSFPVKGSVSEEEETELSIIKNLVASPFLYSIANMDLVGDLKGLDQVSSSQEQKSASRPR